MENRMKMKTYHLTATSNVLDVIVVYVDVFHFKVLNVGICIQQHLFQIDIN